MFDRWRTFVRDRLRDHGRSDNHRLTTNFGTMFAHAKIDIHISLESITLNRFATDRTQLVIIRALVYNGRVVVSDVRDVGRLIHDGDIAFGREECLLDTRRAEFATGNEAILIGPDVVIIVGPIVNAGALIESRFRRERRPSDIILALSPRHPRRRPFIAGNPNPTDAAQTRPASVVIRRPTEWLFGNPSPARVAINPATIRIRPPTRRAFRFARMKNVTVITGLDPIAVGFESRVKS